MRLRIETLACQMAGGDELIPTVNAFNEGGYEPTPARHSQLAENAGQLLVESTCQQLFYLYKQYRIVKKL